MLTLPGNVMTVIVMILGTTIGICFAQDFVLPWIRNCNLQCAEWCPRSWER